MTAATLTRNLEINDPTCEVVVLAVTDGYTYTSRKFSTITAAQATGNEDVDAHLNVTYSGPTATINYAGQSNKLVTLTLYGRK
jgi:hypothetical protein